jgi:hypothetical protein
MLADQVFGGGGVLRSTAARKQGATLGDIKLFSKLYPFHWCGTFAYIPAVRQSFKCTTAFLLASFALSSQQISIELRQRPGTKTQPDESKVHLKIDTSLVLVCFVSGIRRRLLLAMRAFVAQRVSFATSHFRRDWPAILNDPVRPEATLAGFIANQIKAACTSRRRQRSRVPDARNRVVGSRPSQNRTPPTS